jgi:hypothetical protein
MALTSFGDSSPFFGKYPGTIYFFSKRCLFILSLISTGFSIKFSIQPHGSRMDNEKSSRGRHKK